jgi:hypothetical protein
MKITKAIVLALLLIVGLGSLALGRDVVAKDTSDLNVTAGHAQNSNKMMRRRGRDRRKHYRRGRRRHVRKHVM